MARRRAPACGSAASSDSHRGKMMPDRRAFLLGLAAMFSALGRAGRAFAQGGWGIPWTRAPGITVLAAPGDPRLSLVYEAAGFWNRTFAELGSGFRLGGITTLAGE